MSSNPRPPTIDQEPVVVAEADLGPDGSAQNSNSKTSPGKQSGYYKIYQSGRDGSSWRQKLKSAADQNRNDIANMEDIQRPTTKLSHTAHDLAQVVREAKFDRNAALFGVSKMRTELIQQRSQLNNHVKIDGLMGWMFGGKKRQALMSQARQEVRSEFRRRDLQRQHDYQAEMSSHSWFNFPGKLMTAVSFGVSNLWHGLFRESAIKKATNERYHDLRDQHILKGDALKENVAGLQSKIKHTIKSAKDEYKHKIESSDEYTIHEANKAAHKSASKEIWAARGVKAVKSTVAFGQEAAAGVVGVAAGTKNVASTIGQDIKGNRQNSIEAAAQKRIEPTSLGDTPVGQGEDISNKGNKVAQISSFRRRSGPNMS